MTCDDAQSTNVPDAFHRIAVARTVCQWSSVNKLATVQIVNPSGRHVHLKRKMILGYISPVKSVLAQNVSTIQNSSAKSDSAREQLRTALKDSFNNTTFFADQRSQLLDSWTKYRSVFFAIATGTRKVYNRGSYLPLATRNTTCRSISVSHKSTRITRNRQVCQTKWKETELLNNARVHGGQA